LAVADAADRRLYPGLGETLGVSDGAYRESRSLWMNEPGVLGRTALGQSLFQCIEERGRRWPCDQ
jgi:hypothetical protein